MVFQPPRGLASGIGKPDQGRREHGQEWPIPPAPARKPFVATRRPAQRCQRQQDRVFGDPREHIRRDQACEQPAHHAAERQRHIEAGEIFRGRPRARQLAVTGHRDDEETELMPAECQQQILFAADRKQYDHAGNRQRLGQQYPFMRQQWPRLEHQHPGQQIKRQRQHPQQRRRGDVGRDMRGHRDQEARRHRGEQDPSGAQDPGRRRRIGLLGLRITHRWNRRTQQQGPAARDQQDQQSVTAGPDQVLRAQREHGLQQHRIRQQRQETADIGRSVEEVGIGPGGMTGADEPGLQQRIVGGERKERQPDRNREQGQ